MHVDWALILKFFQGCCTHEELQTIERWKQSDLNNQKFFDELAEIWQTSGNLFDAYRPDRDTAWKKMSAKLAIDPKQRKAAPKWIAISRWAAVLTLFVVLGALVWHMLPKQASNPIVHAFHSGDTKKTYKLPDSSLVTMDRNSSLQYISAPKSAKREVTLNGTAYFDVRADKHHPFLVYTSNAGVEVVGTSFYLKTDTLLNKVHLIVSSGKVRFFGINNPDQFVWVEVGEKAVFDISKGLISKERKFKLNETAWKTGNFIFEGERLDEICNMLSDYYRVNILLSDTSMNDLRLTAGFHNQPLINIIQAIEANFDLQADTINKSFVFSDRK